MVESKIVRRSTECHVSSCPVRIRIFRSNLLRQLLRSWETLRSTEGWASFQHHSVLRTTITIYPPSDPSSLQRSPKTVLVDLVQGSYFTIVPAACNGTTSWDGIPKWHSGNIYALAGSTPQAVTLPVSPSVTEPTSYHLFVSGDYEVANSLVISA